MIKRYRTIYKPKRLNRSGSVLLALLLTLAGAGILQSEPILGLSPESFDADSEDFPRMFMTGFNIGNSGDTTLTWNLEIVDILHPEDPRDWIYLQTMSGEVLPGEAVFIPVRIYTTGMVEGVYDSEIVIHSNDPRRIRRSFSVSVAYSGIGEGALQVVPEQVSFDQIYEELRPDNEYVAQIAVANLLEDEAIHLDSAVIVPDVFSINFIEQDVEEQDFAAFEVTLNTPVAGDYIGTLTVYSSDAGEGGAKYIRIEARIPEENSIGEKASLYPSQTGMFCYPNPFNSTATIIYDIAEPSFVSLGVFDMLGRRVGVLGEGRAETGRYEVNWNAGSTPGGVYQVRLDAGSQSLTRCVILVR